MQSASDNFAGAMQALEAARIQGADPATVLESRAYVQLASGDTAAATMRELKALVPDRELGAELEALLTP